MSTKTNKKDPFWAPARSLVWRRSPVSDANHCSSSAVFGAAYHLVFGWWLRPVRAVAARLHVSALVALPHHLQLMGGVDESNQVGHRRRSPPRVKSWLQSSSRSL